MWPKDEIDFPRDDALRAQLQKAGVESRRLPVTSHRDWEAAWRKIYLRAFLPGSRFRHGARAIDEYLQENASRWLIVPFLTKVPGTSVHVHSRQMNAFEC